MLVLENKEYPGEFESIYPRSQMYSSHTIPIRTKSDPGTGTIKYYSESTVVCTCARTLFYQLKNENFSRGGSNLNFPAAFPFSPEDESCSRLPELNFVGLTMNLVNLNPRIANHSQSFNCQIERIRGLFPDLSAVEGIAAFVFRAPRVRLSIDIRLIRGLTGGL